MRDLSPATQAIIDASNCAGSRIVQLHIADAFRAAADQVVPRTPEPAGSKPTAAWHRWNVTGALRLNLLAIAAELEALPE